jgi:hypothetical protein
MTRRLICVIVFFVAIVVGLRGSACAQSKMDRATTAVAAQGQAGPPEGAAATTALPSDPGGVVLGDPATRQQYLLAMQRYYEYRANGYAYRSRVFEWQLLSSRVIFLIVLALVSAGIYFAAVQFRAAMHPAARPAASVEQPPLSGVTLATQLEVSSKGVIVNSSVMGIIILALSLAFFYLYLVYVYPITDVL